MCTCFQMCACPSWTTILRRPLATDHCANSAATQCKQICVKEGAINITSCCRCVRSVPVVHVRITQQTSAIDPFNPFSSGTQQALFVSHSLIWNLYISINSSLQKDFSRQEIVQNPQSFSSVYY